MEVEEVEEDVVVEVVEDRGIMESIIDVASKTFQNTMLNSKHTMMIS